MPKINVYGQFWIDVNSKTEVKNFEFKDKVLPKCKLDEIGSHFCGRYFFQWWKADKTAYYASKPVIANFKIEVVDENKHAKSCLGENILKMDMDRLQDLACECGLIDVPTYNQSGFDLAKSRKKAAFVYLRDVEGLEELANQPYDVWVRNQRDPESGRIENPFDDEELEVVVAKTKRISLKKNKIINKINNLNNGRNVDFGDVTDLSTAIKPKKANGLSQTEIIE